MLHSAYSSRWFALAAILGILICSPPGHAQTKEGELNVVKRCGKDRPFVLESLPSTISLKLDPEQQKQLSGSIGKGASGHGLLLRLGGFKPSASSPFKGGRVFLNLPESATKGHPDLLSPSSPYYAGSFSFFPLEGEENSFYVPAGPTLSRLKERSELPDLGTLRITVVGIPSSHTRDVESSKSTGVTFSEVTLKSKTQSK